MGHLQLGRLGTLGGLRVEETHVEGTGTLQFISPVDIRNVFGDTIGGHPYICIPERPRGSERDDPEIKVGISGQFR